MTLLKVDNLSLSFGGLKVIQSLSFSVGPKSIVSLIGPNGAGKTSVFNCLTGFYKPNGGSIEFDGKAITQLKPHNITKRGIARTFQNVRLFKDMTVLENVMSGMHSRTSALFFGAVFHPPSQQKEEKEILETCKECLEFVGIYNKKNRLAANLPYGDQRRVEWARALATNPKLILLDEPGAGLNFDEKEQLIDLINHIRDEKGITILLIEHDMSLVMEVSEYITVLDYGKKIAEGNSDTIQHDPKVIEAYLGKEDD